MKMHSVMEVYSDGFSALEVHVNRGQWSASQSEERASSINAIGEFMHVRAGLKTVKK
jgi:hypothetical protein